MEKKITEKEPDGKKREDADKICPIHNKKFYEVHYDDFQCSDCYYQEVERQEKESNLRTAIYRAHMELSLPERLKSYTFDSYRPTSTSQEVFDKCAKYVESWPNVGGILMVGGVGTGKTHLATAICQALCNNGVVCQLTKVNRIIRAVRSSWGKWGDKQTEEDVIRDFVKLDLLVIDEIGSQYGTDSERIIINEIIDDRYERNKPTILIGNISVEEAKTIVGARVVDRVKDQGLLLFFEWESHRKLSV